MINIITANGTAIKLAAVEEGGHATLEAEAGEAVGESERPLKLRRDMPGRLAAPEGAMAPEGGLKAGIQSDSARLEAMDRLGDDMAPRFAASSSICSIGKVDEEDKRLSGEGFCLQQCDVRMLKERSHSGEPFFQLQLLGGWGGGGGAVARSTRMNVTVVKHASSIIFSVGQVYQEMK